MEKNTIISSATLYEKLEELNKLAHDSIVNLMASKGISKANINIDQNGHNEDDEDYDENWVYDHRVWVECYGKYCHEAGYVSEVQIDDNNNILLTAEDEDFTYYNDCVSQNVETFIEVLERLETTNK